MIPKVAGVVRLTVHRVHALQLPDLDDDLASCTPRFEVSPSLFGGFERKDPIDDRPDAARFNEGRDLAQLLAVRSHENKRVADAVVPGLLPDAEAQKAHDLLQEPARPVLLGERYIRRTGDGNQLSTGLQQLEGLFERVLAQTVQDDVVAAQDLLEIFFLVVDDDIRAETFDQIDIRGARRRRHRCADVLCQLNGECAYSTGTRMDQDFLALLQVGALNQYLSSCQTHQRDGRCLFHGEILGLQRHVSFMHGDEFRERPDPVLMRPRINLVARLEPSHVGPDPDDDPGHVVAENQRQAIGQNEFELAVPNLGIQLVYTGCVDLDQYIIVA